ncbi:MAG: adenosylmethionine--8-amino-7-oxononanoate transaminase [Ferrovum sp.]|nr:adenosylmethionine--8-amino-7-oxononanoate transaminase [Ferrovum sp.]NDU87074.1 adenosylmethionine--8-amino-7-oxononanoate transaminase [Ferrovum sp.]
MSKIIPLAERSAAAVWHPCTQMSQLERSPVRAIRSAQGSWLHDEDGRRYLDAISSWWVNLFGHCHPAIVAALKAQLDQLDHVMLAGFTHEPVVQLSERLSVRTGGALGHCFYGSDGASATEMALKMSAHYWRNRGQLQKNTFVSLAQGYHGETLGALGVTDIPLFRTAYASLIRGSTVIPSPDSRTPDSEAISLQALEHHLEAHHRTVAAVILEPLVQAAAGMVFHSPEYLRAVAGACQRFDVHLICDEIAVGFGRTGSFFAYQQADITPDFLCLSKGITGGFLPLSAVLTRDQIYQEFYGEGVDRAFLHSHSYTGNALACRAALAVQDLFDQSDILAWNRARHVDLMRISQPLFEHPRVRQGRVRGMIWAFDVEFTLPDFPRRFHEAALAAELLLRPIGNTVYFMPPLNVSEDEFSFLVAGTLTVLEALGI